jgi:hypothetical protein
MRKEMRAILIHMILMTCMSFMVTCENSDISSNTQASENTESTNQSGTNDNLENDDASDSEGSDTTESTEDSGSTSITTSSGDAQSASNTTVTQLEFSGGSDIIEAGSCSPVFSVQRKNSEGIAVDSSDVSSIVLSETLSQARFFSDKDCLLEITTLEILQNQSSATFYIKDNVEEIISIQAASDGLSSAQKSITVSSSPAKIVFIDAPATVTQNECSLIFRVQRQNANSLPANQGVDSITLTSDVVGLTYYSDAACTQSLTDLTIASGQSSGGYYLKHNTIESSVITASAANYVSGSAVVTILQTVDSFVSAVKTSIPDEYSSGVTPTNAFIVPSGGNRTLFYNLVFSIMSGTTTGQNDVLAVLGYKFVNLTDDTIGTQSVIALQETGSTGGGTYLFYVSPQKDFIFESPHPLHDSNTLDQASYLFQQFKARGLLIAGTHRCSNDTASDASTGLSACDGTTTACNDVGGNPARKFPISDVAHSLENYFQEAHKAAYDFNASNILFSIHGKSAASPAVIISNGENDANPSSKSISLVTYLEANLTLDSDDPVIGESCNDGYGSLCGTTNVQGRYVNHSADLDANDDACLDYATSGSDRFFHLEQSPEIRDDLVNGSQLHWPIVKAAIEDTF